MMDKILPLADLFSSSLIGWFSRENVSDLMKVVQGDVTKERQKSPFLQPYGWRENLGE